MSKKLNFGSGNIFKDLGLDSPEERLKIANECIKGNLGKSRDMLYLKCCREKFNKLKEGGLIHTIESVKNKV